LAIVVLFDWIEDTSEIDESRDLRVLGKTALYTAVALQILLIVLALNAVTRGEGFWPALGAFLTLTYTLALTCGNVGHELSHSRKRIDQEIGRLLFAFCLHSALSIDHIYHHHRHVATTDDHASAWRGQRLLPFVVNSFMSANRKSWSHEKRRAQVKNYPVWSVRNRFLLGHAMELGYLGLVFAVFGLQGLLLAVLAAIFAIRGIEGFSYVAHYGLVRVPGEKCEARHSWNSRRLVSSSLMFSITAHSQHHLEPQRPYWQLQADDKCPLLPHGIIWMNVLALSPKAWSSVMDPALEQWDRDFASDAELALIAGNTVTRQVA
jgi:fatty acid desaturase